MTLELSVSNSFPVPSKQRTSVRWVREPACGIILMDSPESCIFVKMAVKVILGPMSTRRHYHYIYV